MAIANLIQAVYFVAFLLFIFGLKRMSSPVTARNGIIWAGIGMLAAVIVTFFMPDLRGKGRRSQPSADDGLLQVDRTGPRPGRGTQRKV